MKRFIRRPSPALVISCIALFASLGGVGFAAATGSIDGREIKNGTIRNVDFKDGTLRGNEAKPNGFGGGAIKESSLSTVPSADALAKSAVVSPAGAVVRERGVSSATRGSTGRYTVVFDENIQRCTYIATVGDEGLASPGSGVATVSGNPTNGNAVNVRTANATNNAVANRSFHLLVSC